MQLLQKYGANLQDTTNTGASLLHYAALNDNVPVIQYLLQNNLDPNSSTEEQETPLHGAPIWPLRQFTSAPSFK
ncbi:ankyrin repeat domain protein [Leptospira weilii serovar Ranarum str. ICFT]|uniref:Ankyrin repeat domain protein n=1 Tax=Leptospira weilii serovar Ranarum str. ICFT TaxID=1218598 RepID=N1WLV1_9LEPT|nr:ankyrin repeat domain protein [Leptospira weilii serovar Ranarum str. ICFT]